MVWNLTLITLFFPIQLYKWLSALLRDHGTHSVRFVVIVRKVSQLIKTIFCSVFPPKTQRCKCFHPEHLLHSTRPPASDRFHGELVDSQEGEKKWHSAVIQGHASANASLKSRIQNIYLASAHDVGLGRQQIDDFSFALVSPLRAEHHRRLVPRVVARSLLSGRGGLIHVFVVFRRPGERHDGGGFSPSVSRRLKRLQEWHCHICNFIADDVRARRAEVRSCARTARLQGC